MENKHKDDIDVYQGMDRQRDGESERCIDKEKERK